MSLSHTFVRTYPKKGLMWIVEAQYIPTVNAIAMGYTYDNGMVSKWMSEDKKDLPDNLTDNDGVPVFLLMKQAISTGWDCPRATILVNFVKE